MKTYKVTAKYKRNRFSISLQSNFFMELLEIRIGQNKPPPFYEDFIPNWPEKQYTSSYAKEPVELIEVDENGIVGNEVGFPTHIDNYKFRTALVFNELIWEDFERYIPGAKEKFVRGCFGENFVVNHPLLHPSKVCIGDKFRIGSAVFTVSGPRMPCPKVDAFVGVKGLTALGKKTCWTGYFLQVLEGGQCRRGDLFELLERPYPDYTLSRISQGLWGDEGDLDNSEEFLSTLSEIECLMPRHYRDTAKLRLERIAK